MRMTKAFTTLSLAAALAAAPAALATDTGGATSSAAPEPESVSCWKRCAALDAAQPGSTVRVYGRELGQVGEVVFLGAAGPDDDVSVKPSKARSHTVYVRVPPRAVGGPLLLINGDGTPSKPTPPVDIDHGPTRISASDTRGSGAVQAKVESRKAFFDGRKAPALTYLVKGDASVPVTVTLLRAGTDTIVAQWTKAGVEPGTVQRIAWDGMDRTTKKSAARGRYEFLVYTGAGNATAARKQSKPTAALSFLFLDHQFPIRGRHNYGEAQAAFGAGRSGHIHQGQDVMADCGLPLVAARGGTVKFAGFQSRAGNYIVIDGAGTTIDYVYMHLRQPALFKKGQKVRTGDQLGQVGDTGDATACHLHFELWNGPGWYTGGSPFDPAPSLRAWDQYS
jgi:murein DD-endopeptidase MepM/ murein hydrolase activator NlpD